MDFGVASPMGSSKLWVGDGFGSESLIGEIGVEVGGNLHRWNQEEQRFGFMFERKARGIFRVFRNDK